MFQPNAVIAGRYQVVRLVGQGGMSNLYLAYDRKYSNATVVVKEMTASYSDPKEQKMAVDLFHREAKLLASLNHRHIPKVFDYFQFAGKYYLSMEYIDGVDLAIKLEEEKGALPEEQVLQWGQQIATVLFYLHKHEPPIVFRDVKPSNIMISSKGVKLIDFGIARHFDQAKKGDTMRIGSPGYAPPEQYTAQTDPRSDIYALGVTLHHALTGRDPTATSTPFLVPPARDLNPSLSEATQTMLARATQLDPDDRYQSALNMKRDIKKILNRESQSTRVVTAPPKPVPKQAASSATAASNQQAATPDQGPAKSAATTSAVAATPSSTPANTAPTNTPSNSTNAAANPGKTGGSQALAATQDPDASSQQQPPSTSAKNAKKGRKRLSLGKLLAVALVLLVGSGVGALGFMESEKRDNLLLKTKATAGTWWADLTKAQAPEDRLRNALLAGTPEALIPLFQSDDFKTLSQDKQELFRLNLLAASSSAGPIKMVNILIPESQEQSEIWEMAATVVRSANSSQGLGRELLTVVPQTYRPDRLERLLKNLAEAHDDNVQQSFLVLSEQKKELPTELSERVVFLSSKVEDVKSELQSLQAEGISFQDSFGLYLDTSETPIVWATPGTAPSFALNSGEDNGESLDLSKLKELLEQAESSGGRLAIRAQDVQLLKEHKSEANLLLLAATPGQLPSIDNDQAAEALVLSSPFEAVISKAALRPRLQSKLPVNLSKARLFDAIILTSMKAGNEYQGITITRDSDGLYTRKKPTLYQWNKSSWLPKLNETRTNP